MLLLFFLDERMKYYFVYFQSLFSRRLAKFKIEKIIRNTFSILNFVIYNLLLICSISVEKILNYSSLIYVCSISVENATSNSNYSNSNSSSSGDISP